LRERRRQRPSIMGPASGVVHPEVWLGNDCSKQRRVPAKTRFINGRLRVDIHTVREQPSGNLDLVIIDAEVKERRSLQWRSLCRIYFVMTSHLWRVNLLVCEGAR